MEEGNWLCVAMKPAPREGSIVTCAALTLWVGKGVDGGVLMYHRGRKRGGRGAVAPPLFANNCLLPTMTLSKCILNIVYAIQEKMVFYFFGVLPPPTHFFVPATSLCTRVLVLTDARTGKHLCMYIPQEHNIMLWLR